MLRLLLVASSKDDAPRTEAYALELGDHSVFAEEREGRGGTGRYYDILRIVKFCYVSVCLFITLPLIESFQAAEICPGILCICTTAPVPPSKVPDVVHTKIIFPFPRLRPSSSALCVRRTSTITAIVEHSTNTHADLRSLRPSTHHCPLVAPKPGHPHQFSTQNPPHRHRGQLPTHGEFTHANDHGCSGGFEIGCHLHVRDGKERTTTITASTTTATMTVIARGSKRLR